MNRSDFFNMMGSKDPLNRSLIGEVYELIDLFPYFQSAHLLLLKGLKDNEDIKFEKQLRSSSVYIADREVLYYLLKSEKKMEPGQESISSDTKSVISQTSAESIEIPDTEQTVIETAKNSDFLISEFESGKERPEGNEQEDKELITVSHSVLIQGNTENDENDRVIFIMDENNQGEEENIFFMDPGFSIPEKSELLELENGNYTSSDEYEQDNEATKPEPDRKGSRKQLQTELIDKFIITNPRIEPAREKSNLPVEDLSRPHVEEKESFVTETLARIYVTQGYYSKAIDIYEKLSLKFPEKSSYFATQIEKVKEYIK
ncbi:MAG: hypothetical protein IPN68_04365 [Bacteroidetes bacterium]|nr:hypothetical protein [Bacteroidota bacterium]